MGTPARRLEALVAQSRQNKNASMTILLSGWPDIGKSALARWFQYDAIGCCKFSITRLDGTQVNLDRVEDIAAGLPWAAVSFRWSGHRMKFRWQAGVSCVKLLLIHCMSKQKQLNHDDDANNENH